MSSSLSFSSIIKMLMSLFTCAHFLVSLVGVVILNSGINPSDSCSIQPFSNVHITFSYVVTCLWAKTSSSYNYNVLTWWHELGCTLYPVTISETQFCFLYYSTVAFTDIDVARQYSYSLCQLLHLFYISLHCAYFNASNHRKFEWIVGQKVDKIKRQNEDTNRTWRTSP